MFEDPQIARASLNHNIWLFLRLYICDIFPVIVSKRPRDGTQIGVIFLNNKSNRVILRQFRHTRYDCGVLN